MGCMVPIEPRSFLKPTGRLEAGAPSASEDVGTRYVSPTSRLEAGAPSTSEDVGTRYAGLTGRQKPAREPGRSVEFLPSGTPTGLYDKAQGKRAARHPGLRSVPIPNPERVL